MSEFNMTRDEFHRLMVENEEELTVHCAEDGCEFAAPPGPGEAQARVVAEHMMAGHGYDPEAAMAAEVKVTVGTGGTCPRCARQVLRAVKVRNALSRTDSRTYICEACSTDEALESMAAGKVTPRSAWPVPARHTPERHGFQSPDWREQRSNRAHRPNPVPAPKELPDLRLHLLERWVEGGVFDRTAEEQPRTLGVGSSKDGVWERKALRNASLWWIKDEMIDLVTAAAPSIPDEVQGGEVDLPAEQPYGLAVFGKTWEGIDSVDTESPCRVDAILWGPAIVAGVPVLTMSCYRYIDFAGGMSPPELALAASTGLITEAKSERIGYSEDMHGPAFRLFGGAWAWLGRTDWPLEAGLTDFGLLPAHPGDTEQRTRAMTEDRRWFASLCVLVNHRLSETEPVYAVRQTRRRAERAGVDKDAAVSTVRIIRLRQAKHEHPDGEAGEGRHVEWTHRWLVGSHMAWRRCGPKRSQRKLVFIAPYVKGPADRPLVIKENVRVWVK